MKTTIKKLLPKAVIGQLKSLANKFGLFSLALMGRSRVLAKLGYGLLSSRFSRENFVVASGIAEHHRLRHSGKESHARLRRNTHRLEKGLLMQPLRPVFGLAYLPQLVSDYRTQLNNHLACAEELQWAYNVLAEYFNLVDTGHPLIAEQKQRFDHANHRHDAKKSYKPYPRSESLVQSISYDQFKALAWQRRSVRWFKNTPVERNKVEAAMEAASLAPSACNRQPYQVYVIDKPELLERATHYPMGTAGWAHNIPMLAVIVGDFSSFEAARDRHVPYIDASLAAMNLMLALETLGLSSCPINWPDIEIRERRMAKLLKLDTWQRPIMCMAIGYAQEEGGIAYSQKKLPEQLIRYVD